MKNFAFVAALTALVLVVGTALYRWSGLNDTGAMAPEQRPPDAQLSQRLAIAYGALRDAEGARRLPESIRYALVAIDAIVGPDGRHGRVGTPPGGILPADTAALDAERGLALRAYEAAPDGSPLKTAITAGITGDVAAWRTPAVRYDAIDRAVTEYRADNNTIAALPGGSARALAWALLTLKTENINAAHDLAGRGAREAKASLDAVRTARAAGQ